MRDVYRDTAALAGAGGALAALSGIQVTVNVVSPDGTTGALATIYQGRTGAAQGPTPASGAVGNNPFTTGASGSIEFFADPGEYIITIHDPASQPRIGDRTMYWNSLPAQPGGIPGDRISGDAKLPLAALAADVMRQVAPLGAVIDWWRPASDIAVPTGFAVCDGSAVAAGAHDFGGSAAGTTITLPDLRNAFVLGANTANADGAAGAAVGVNVDQVASAPGIGGKGGSHKIDLSHAHTANDHTHNVNGHAHGFSIGTVGDAGATADAGGLGYNWWGSNDRGGAYNSGGGFFAGAYSVGTTVAVVSANVGKTTIGLTKFRSDGATDSQSPGTGGASNRGMSTMLSTTSEQRPQYIGLLKIMKIKRS